MNQINIIPKIIHDKFAARIIMDDYDIEKPIVITAWLDVTMVSIIPRY